MSNETEVAIHELLKPIKADLEEERRHTAPVPRRMSFLGMGRKKILVVLTCFGNAIFSARH